MLLIIGLQIYNIVLIKKPQRVVYIKPVKDNTKDVVIQSVVARRDSAEKLSIEIGKTYRLHPDSLIKEILKWQER